MSNTAPSRADPVVVFPLGRWCPPQETSQPHPPPSKPKSCTHSTGHIACLMAHDELSQQTFQYIYISKALAIEIPQSRTKPLIFTCNNWVRPHEHQNSGHRSSWLLDGQEYAWNLCKAQLRLLYISPWRHTLPLGNIKKKLLGSVSIRSQQDIVCQWDKCKII